MCAAHHNSTQLAGVREACKSDLQLCQQESASVETSMMRWGPLLLVYIQNVGMK